MKKIMQAVALVSLLILIGCVKRPAAPSGTAVEIADRVFEESGVKHFGTTTSLQEDQSREYFLGTSDYPAFSDSVAISPLINVDTRVLVIILAEEKSSVDAIETALKENIDPNRLICVSFTMEDVAIESRGNVVFMTINTDAEQRQQLVDAFLTIE